MLYCQPPKTPNSALRSLDKMLIYLMYTPLLSRSQALISGFSEVAYLIPAYLDNIGRFGNFDGSVR